MSQALETTAASTPRFGQPGQLKSQFRIGSIHGRVSYDLHERVFHPSDVPEHARKAKQEVKEYTLGDVLGITKPVFHPSTTCETLDIAYKRGCPWDSRDKVRESSDYKRLDAIAKYEATQTRRLQQAETLRDLHRDKSKLQESVLNSWNSSTAIDSRILKRKYIFPEGVSQHEVPLRLTYDLNRKDSLTQTGRLVSTQTATQRVHSAPLCIPRNRKSLVELAKADLVSQRIHRAQSKLEHERQTIHKRALEFAKYDGAWSMYVPRPMLGNTQGTQHTYETEAERLATMHLGAGSSDEASVSTKSHDVKEALLEDEIKVAEVVNAWEQTALGKASILIRNEASYTGPVCPHGIFVASAPKICGKCLRSSSFVNHNPKATQVAVQVVAAKRRTLATAAAAASAKVAVTASAVAITGAEAHDASTSHDDPILKAHADAVENASQKTRELQKLQSQIVLLQPVPPRSAPLTRAAITQSISQRYSQEELERFVAESERQSPVLGTSSYSTENDQLPPGAAFSDIGEFSATARQKSNEDKPRRLSKGKKTGKSRPQSKLDLSSAQALYAEIRTDGFDLIEDSESDLDD